ncbi:hypothetical protein KIW84_044688 [Lathyrus oleraceus]|uniref:Uncharacterized protein n=1 Tax=Pisum sativum TaxID=3888 RepID=A0A9D4XIE3_PEA|nr:hypothetical protein KIW84_044688 [Pisum sativum]
MLLGSEHKLVMLSATGLLPSRVQHSTASPSSTTLVLLSHNPVFTVVSCLLVNSAAVRKVDLFGNPRIYAYFQLPEAFRRLLHPSSSLGS